jgi:sterol desaturase/sphingolipid hydroxylase (fatty acid hydroxylase superfamily)
VANVAVSLAVVVVAVWDAPRLLVGFAIAALLAASLEVLLPLSAAPVSAVPFSAESARRSRWSTDLTYAVGNRTLILPALSVLLAVISLVSSQLPTGPLRSLMGQLPGPARFVVFFVLSDLANYLTHRMLHRVGWLWRLHAVHHSSERVDWLATARGHPLDQAINIAGASVPLYLVGGARYAPEMVAFLYLYPFLLHAAARVNLGPVRLLVVTPEFHHWHHARDPRAHNRNFGAVLSVWDRLFRTAVHAQGRPTEYGIEDRRVERRPYLGQVLAPLVTSEVAQRLSLDT